MAETHPPQTPLLPEADLALLLPEEEWHPLRVTRWWEPDEVVGTSSTPQLPPSPETAGPFLGFDYLGMASESELTRDYDAEARAAEAQERSRLKKLQRSSKEILANGVLDGSYGRYLKGE